MKILKRIQSLIEVAIVERNDQFEVMVITRNATGGLTSTKTQLYNNDPTKEQLAEQLDACLTLHAIGMAKALGAT